MLEKLYNYLRRVAKKEFATQSVGELSGEVIACTPACIRDNISSSIIHSFPDNICGGEGGGCTRILCAMREAADLALSNDRDNGILPRHGSCPQLQI